MTPPPARRDGCESPDDPRAADRRCVQPVGNVIDRPCHRLLAITPDDGLAADLERELARVDDIELVRVVNGAEADRLRDEGPFDVVLIEMARHAHADLTEEVGALRRRMPGSAIITVLDERDPALAAATVAEGAQDVLVRGEFTSGRLAKSVRLACVRARSMQTLQHTVDALEERNARLDDFVRAVGHDLRSPIRTARALTDLAEERSVSDPTQLHDLLRRIDSALARLDDRVAALLRLARAGAATADLRDLRLGDVVDRVVADLSADIEDRGATVRCPRPDATVMADADLLAELLQNLVANSLAYARPGVRPDIVIDSAVAGPDLIVTVTDNGVGIPDSARDAVFEMFTRLARDDRGSGLGLPLCRRLAEVLGGRIWIEPASAPSGTTVALALPRRRGPRRLDHVESLAPPIIELQRRRSDDLIAG